MSEPRDHFLSQAPPATQGGVFPATKWSLVVRSRGENAEVAQRALGELLEIYWQPLYVFARQSGLAKEDAQDAVQGFCESLIRRGSLRSADQELGKLRSFLLGGFENHVRTVFRNGQRLKRGGGVQFVRWEDNAAVLESALVDGQSPDVAFDRLWAQRLLQQVLERLRSDYAARGKQALVMKLGPLLSWRGGDETYAQIAAELNMSVTAVAQALKRMRARYRVLLEEEIAQTVDSQTSADEERAHLIQVFALG